MNKGQLVYVTPNKRGYVSIPNKNNMGSGYYPPGAENDPRAPYNQVDPPDKEIEVLVSITLSKTVKVRVNDYTIEESGKDEDGSYYQIEDYSNCDLKSAVKEQITLPQEAYIYLGNYAYEGGYTDPIPEVNDLKDWNVDEFEVILE